MAFAKRDKYSRTLLSALIIMLVVISLMIATPTYADSTIVVTTTDDELDGAGGGGFSDCSLREAIANANNDNDDQKDCLAGSGLDTVVLKAGETYTISLFGIENNNQTGDFDLLDVDGIIIKSDTENSTATIDGADTARILDHRAGPFDMTDITIQNGKSTRGGAGLESNNICQPINLLRVVFFSNAATAVARNGGAISINCGITNTTVTITDSTFKDNQAGAGKKGGAIFTTGRKLTLNISGSTFTGNKANGLGQGGAIYFSTTDNKMNIINSTFFDNFAGNDGGAIYVKSAIVTIQYSTIVNNQAGTGAGHLGGGIFRNGGRVDVSTSIIANNTAGGGNPDCNSDIYTTNHYNWIENMTGCKLRDAGGGPQIAPFITGVDPTNLAGALANNGGLTQTLALSDLNTATDGVNEIPNGTANCGGSVTTDQRGVTRPTTGSCDIGAYELESTPPEVASTTLLTTYITGPFVFDVTYTEDVANLYFGLGDDDVTNPANYVLLEESPVAGFQTTSCAAVSTDDTAYAVDSVTYDDGTHTATVNINGGVALPGGNYRLFVCGTTSIVDHAGNALNNGANDTTVDFIVEIISPTLPSTLPSTLPDTGFAPNSITQLPIQPVELAYANMASSGLLLVIPQLGVETEILGVPLSEGKWDTTWLGQSAGWLNETAYPTWEGNTVITGHVWDSWNQPGLFSNLKELKYGDQFEIHAYGMTYTYEVRSTERVREDNLSVLGHSEFDTVTLLTCESYNFWTGDYRYRRAVQAVLVGIGSD